MAPRYVPQAEHAVSFLIPLVALCVGHPRGLLMATRRPHALYREEQSTSDGEEASGKDQRAWQEHINARRSS